MKTVITSFFLLLLFVQSSFSQLDDILKKIPGVGDVLIDKAVTTSIKDAYPSALWLNGLDKKISYDQNAGFNLNLGAGYYRYKFNTFCLHAGTYAPTEGSGYLVAPLKGSKAELIKSILGRYYEHPEIEQTDVQMLVWGIEAGQKFSNYDAAFQYRVAPLLKPEEIAMMEVDVKDIAYDLLPQEAKDVLDLYSEMRGKLSDANATYEDVERLAVKTGIAPLGKGSKNIEAGEWTSIGDGVYMRSFPEGYRKSQVEIYIPAETKIEKDSKGSISMLDDGQNSISVEYDVSGVVKQVSLKNTNTNDQQTIDNGTIDNNELKKSADELVSLIKKSFGKKKSKNITTGVIKDINQLKAIESYVSSGTAGDNAKQLTLNALNNYISNLESGNKKGGGKDHKTGLSNLSGLVFAPANTSQQRLGNGGPEGGNGTPPNGGDPTPPTPPDKEKDCKVKVYISQVNENELPKPDWVYTVKVEISIEGTDEKCEAEEIKFNFLDVSKERGRYMNDKEKYDDMDDDLKFSDLNQGFTITGWTASKPLSGKSQTVEAYIVCNDYGAFGRLGATVKVKGNWYTAEADGTPDPYITIPVDLNDNKIADSWEKQNNVYGKPGTWDEDPNPKGQKRPGDGMTNYEEYRGFMVSDGAGGTEYKRMDPMQKEIFVIDMDNLFVPVSWKAATGITGYWMTPDLVFGDKGGDELQQPYRWVNFCRGNAPGFKYAVLLKRITTIDDPYKLCGIKTDYTGCNEGSPVINAKLTLVLTERTRKWLTDTKDTMTAWIAKFPKAKKLVVGGHTVLTSWMKKFIDAVNNPTKLQEIINFYDNQIAIHEMGHALGVNHHGKDKNQTSGAHDCPMRYFEYIDPVFINEAWMKKVLDMLDTDGNLIVTYTKWKFCKTKDNCWKQLDAKDD
ncbi:MAG: hypothetical protein ABI543_12800 [Ignavibacteria bacterium]